MQTCVKSGRQENWSPCLCIRFFFFFLFFLLACQAPMIYSTTYSFEISSGVGGVTGVGPVTVIRTLPPGVCFPFEAAPLPPGAPPFPPLPAGAFCLNKTKYM